MKIAEFIRSKRRCGHTEYMLRAAVNDPKVIIVAANESHVSMLRERYFRILSQQPWYKRLWWWWIKRKEPIFISKNKLQDAYSVCAPVQVDNYAYFVDAGL